MTLDASAALRVGTEIWSGAVGDSATLQLSGALTDRSITLESMKFTGRVLAGFPAKDLKPMVDDLKKKIGSGVIVLIATDEGKASIVVPDFAAFSGVARAEKAKLAVNLLSFGFKHGIPVGLNGHTQVSDFDVLQTGTI